jgi:hypothetical protein
VQMQVVAAARADVWGWVPTTKGPWGSASLVVPINQYLIGCEFAMVNSCVATC